MERNWAASLQTFAAATGQSYFGVVVSSSTSAERSPSTLVPPVLLLVLALGVAAYVVSTRESDYIKRPIPTQSPADKPRLLPADIEIDPTGFYRRLRLKKLLLAATVLVLAALALFSLAWDAVRGAGRIEVVEQALMSAFWIVLFTLAAFSFSLPSTDIDRHWTYTVSLSILTLTSAALTALRLILPTEASVIPPSHDSAYVTTVTLESVTTFLQVIAFYFAGTTNRCAPLGQYLDKPVTDDATGENGKGVVEVEAGGTTVYIREVSALTSCSPIAYILFGWISPVLRRSASLQSLSEHDLPLLGKNDRAETLWEGIRYSDYSGTPRFFNRLLWRVIKINKNLFIWQMALAFITAFLYYLPAYFLQQLVQFLEYVPDRSPSSPPRSLAWGYVYCLGLFTAAVLDALVSGQLWFVSNSMLATRIRVQLNCLVFDKTLKRKDVAGVSGGKKEDKKEEDEGEEEEPGLFSETKETFNNKSQVMNLFSIDIDRVADFSVWCFSIVDAPAEILIGTYFLHHLLGYAAFLGISVAIVFLPINHYTSKAFASVQDRLMSSRDKRVSLMNEVLQSIRMIKYFAWEDPFTERIMAARGEELKQLRRNFYLEVGFNAIWSISPILCVLVSFWVFTSDRFMGRELTPSIAFASLAVWNELRFALNIIPELLVQAISCIVSLRRIEKYLNTENVSLDGTGVNATDDDQETSIAFRDATVTWAKTEEKTDGEANGSGTTTPGATFQLQDINVEFPEGSMSLVCGSLGAGKTLLLLALLGEADVLAGQVVCPRSPPDAISLPNIDWDQLLTEENWVQPHRTAFVPQSAWLQNASIKQNILFGLPMREGRYQATLYACSLLSDLEILEDGDETEIGEKGIGLSGGQKARVSLARAVYSRASILALDDVLSAVDAHTSAHIFSECLQGPLMKGRTVILVSHHVQLTAPGCEYVVELENGRVKFQGSSKSFLESERFKTAAEEEDPIEDKAAAVTSAIKSPTKPKPKAVADLVSASTYVSETSSASEGEDESDAEVGMAKTKASKKKEKGPRKLIEDESKAVGRVSWSVWKLYLGLCGGFFFWTSFILAFAGTKAGLLIRSAALPITDMMLTLQVSDVAQSFWLNIWAASYDAPDDGRTVRSVNFYLAIYAVLSVLAVLVSTLQWFVVYSGTLRASDRLYRKLLRSVLRAPLRFFDTQALGRIINRFAKDFEGIDSAWVLPDHFARSLMYGLGVLTTLVVVASVAPLFLVGFALLSIVYFQTAVLFSKTARELRRLDSVSKSPLYSIYGEAIAGVAVIRAFGSSHRFMQLMLDRTARNVNRWLSIRFALLSAIVVGLTGVVLLLSNGKIDAALVGILALYVTIGVTDSFAQAGFALTFSLNISTDMLFLTRRYTSLELAMVAVERVKEYSEIDQEAPEAPEVIEPRPPHHWPHSGEIHVEKLTIRYAPELPDVLHELSFSVGAGQKVGIVGATGCGKSTLALSFFRFVEAHSGRIVIDGIDIAKVGLKDLRSSMSIIAQDPTILSGTLRSTLDIFSEYTDQEIFDSLRRVHLLPPEGEQQVEDEGANRSPFFDLSSEVSEGGSNFSQGQRQLLCMARALLKRNRLLLLDEATASVDYETDEKISNTIRQEFAESTLLVIAHRLRTVIDFDRILVLDAGKIVEYDHPATLVNDSTSRFHALCRATGKTEFKILSKMANGKTRATHKPRKLVKRSSSKAPGPTAASP
ncbi:ATP-binding cassette transporter [Pseudohyphozyma bogoriensis]|nr:ATP-binding cassette transporter [Pseudohyphozyma bogoriensis]